ncbi:protocadherin gamma-C5-like [Cyanistes caeruleus]|nr:protocadherin gamma-C5-like [Cyanistes caeruleus]
MESVSLQRPAWKWQVLSLFLLCGWGWVSGQIHYSVVEESELGTVVGNVARDLGLKVEELPGRRLRLGSEESLRYFAVRLDSGTLVVSQRLDRERLCGAAASCVLSVQVVTENPLQLFRLEVEILDLNDNSPSFPTAHRTLRIAESATVAARFPLESAQDPDVGTNAVSSYWLSPNSHFSLDVKQQPDGKLFPELVLERALDREEQPEVQLVLTAVDGGSPARSGTAQITVQVLDVNDNAPVFDHTTYKVKVPENTPVGAVLLRVNASDPDEGPNGETQYSFGVHTSDSVRRLFALDPRSGEVRVSGALDFEESRFYEIYVRAHDGGVPEMEGNCVLQVQVEDANDNPPEVLLTSLLNPVPEDTPPETVVGLFNVRDRDSGANGDVSLEISPDVPFAIRSLQNHFSLVTQKSLDRESTSQYAVELIAQDGGSPALTTTLTLLLNISDVNDNPPRFSQPSYEAFLQENNPPGSLLCTVSASDPDAGDNSRLVYSIESGQVQDAPISSFVHINPDNGNLYAQRTFDFEVLQVLPVSVVVRDSGSPPLYANITVYIFVLDQNDHPPTILYPASDSDVPAPQRVPLSAPPGYLVAKVTAVDADAGHNAWLSYRLLPQSTDPSLFHVSLYTGEVRTARAFQDSDMAVQQLVVQVMDNGDPPLSTTATITVALEEAALEESFKPQDFLAGAKEKPDLTFYLIIALAAISTVALATLSAPLRSHTRHGMLSGQSLPWQLPLLLAALSCLPAPSYAQLHYSVPEDREPGFSVGDLAKDLGVEVRSLAARNLRLVSEGGQRHFKVDLAAGVLLLDGRLDREALCGQSPTCSLHLQLVMENPLQLHRVEVDVLDVNDNAPQFPKPEVVLEITEVANPGTRLPLEVAEDPDMGSNSISTYELSPSKHFALSINVRGDGVKMPEIVLEKALDREKVPVHHLTLTALDGGNPVKSGTARVTIHVLDANDNPPVCDPPISKVLLEENVPVGTLVTKLNVTDLDEGPNGDVEYSFKTSNNAPGKFTKLFSLDARTGEIRTKAPLDYEESGAYEIAVRARDKGSPAMEGHCHLRVELIDINDNSPEIVLTSVSSPVQEDAAPGTVIALIGVKDSDSGDNGQVRLQIAKELPFKLVSSFKEHFSLVTSGPLDREKASGYNITVRAVDSGSPQRATQKTFYLRIADVNDNAPNFSSPFDTAHIQENSLPGTSVFSVSASDPDEGSNAKLSYSILDNGMQDVPISTYFRIDQDNGTIYTVRALDYEQDKVFQVPVEVKDAGSPALSSTAVVHVFVLDENDNAPSIVYPSVPKGSAFHQAIPALAEPGYLVTKIVAVDADSGHNAWLSYQLQESAEALPFQVERRTGEIRVAQALRESEDSHRLVVEVRDNGTPSLSASVVIVISPEENSVQDFSKSLDLPESSPEDTNLTLYLIISLVSISLVSCVMFGLAAARCLKAGNASWTLAGCCRGTGRKPASHFRGQMKPDGFIKYLDVGGAGLTSQAQNYTSCFSPMSDQSDFLFVKPFSHSSTAETVAAYEQVTSTLASPCDGQAQPNTDWRFSQTQRPGTSGSQNGEEAGAWPNNQFDTEMLQAMILASANEAADGNSTLGGGNGTMGLSARYGPQFTLQHVPDYRQNVYIPGSNATLTNAAGKRDAKNAAPAGGNKKKSGKKEKK